MPTLPSRSVFFSRSSPLAHGTVLSSLSKPGIALTSAVPLGCSTFRLVLSESPSQRVPRSLGVRRLEQESRAELRAGVDQPRASEGRWWSCVSARWRTASGLFSLGLPPWSQRVPPVGQALGRQSSAVVAARFEVRHREAGGLLAARQVRGVSERPTLRAQSTGLMGLDGLDGL